METGLLKSEDIFGKPKAKPLGSQFGGNFGIPDLIKKEEEATKGIKTSAEIFGTAPKPKVEIPEVEEPIVPKLEDMKVQENNLIAMSKAYDDLGKTLDTDYEIWEGLSQEIDNIDEEMQTATPEMQFRINQKRSGLVAQHNELVDKLKEDTEKHKKLYVTLDSESKSFNANIGIYNQYIQTQAREEAEPEYIPEGDLKDSFDAFRLGSSGIFHNTKQYFNAALPNLIYADVKLEDQKYYKRQGLPIGLSEEQIKKVNEVNKEKREIYKEKYHKAEERYDKWLVEHPELVPRPEWSQGVIENVKKNPKILLDPAYWGYEASQSAAFMLSVMGTTVGVTAATGNPLLGMAAGVAVATPSQSQDVWEELVANGATEEQASKIAVPLGVAIASVEVLGDLPLLAAVSKPFKKLLFKGIKKEITKRTALSIAKSGVKTFFAVEGAEIMEENIQLGMQEAAVNVFRENKSLLEKIPETTLKTFMATAPWAIFGMGANIRSNINERLKQKIAENNIKTALKEEVEIPKEPEVKPTVEGKEEVVEIIGNERDIHDAKIAKSYLLEEIEKEMRNPFLKDEELVNLKKNKEALQKENKAKVILGLEEVTSYQFKEKNYFEKETPEVEVKEPTATREGEFNPNNYTNPLVIGRELESYPTEPILLARQAQLIFEQHFEVNKKKKKDYPIYYGEQDLQAAINNLKNDFGGAENYPEAQRAIEKAQAALDQLRVEPEVPKEEPIPKDLEPLAEEARKYKSAEEYLPEYERTIIFDKYQKKIDKIEKQKEDLLNSLEVNMTEKKASSIRNRIDELKKPLNKLKYEQNLLGRDSFGDTFLKKATDFYNQVTAKPEEARLDPQLLQALDQVNKSGKTGLSLLSVDKIKELLSEFRKHKIFLEDRYDNADWVENSLNDVLLERHKAGQETPEEKPKETPETYIPPKTALSEENTLKALEAEAVRLGKASWEKLSRKEVNTLLENVKTFKDPEGKLLKKVGKPDIDLWKDEDFAITGILAGEKVHKITDSHWIFIDDKVADEVIADQKKRMFNKQVKDYMKRLPDISKAEAEKYTEDYFKKIVDDRPFPNWKDVVKSAEKVRTKDKAYIQGYTRAMNDNFAILSNGNLQVQVNTNYLNMMNKWLPNADIQLGKKQTDMVSFVDPETNKIQAVLMPVRYEDEILPFKVWDIPGGVKPKVEVKVKKPKIKKEGEAAFLERPTKKQKTLIPGMEEPQVEEQELSARTWGQEMEKEETTPKRINKTEIMTWADKAFGFPIKSKATHKWKAAGVFYYKKQIVRMAKWGELAVAAHEIAHGIDSKITKKLYNLWKWGERKGITGEFTKELADLDYDQTQNGRRTAEGFAEYMRYELTMGIGKKKAPNFHKYFNEKILPQFPELKKNLDLFKQKLDIWNKQGAENRIIQHIDWKGEHSKTRGIGAKLMKALEWINIRFNDEFYFPQKITKKIEEIIGRKLPPSKNPALLMEYSKAKSGAIARTFVMDKAIDEHGNVVGDSLVEVLKDIPNSEMPQFIAYAVGVRALNLSARDIESGFDLDDARFIVEKYKDKGWKSTAKRVTEWSNHMLDWIVRAGGLSEETAKLMRDLNPIYLPFKRAFLEEINVTKGVGGYVDTGKAVKTIKGSGRPIINPIESLITQTRELIAKAQKIRIAKAFIDLAYEHGVGGFITKVPAPMKATTFSANQIKGYLDEIASGEEGMTSGNTYNEFLTVFTQDFKYSGKENIVSIWRDGKQEFYEIHPDLYEAFKGVDPLKLGAITKVFAPFSRMLRLGATGLKLSFGLARNPFRDAFSYVVFSKRNNTTIFDPIKGYYQEMMTKPGEATWRFKKLGGGLSGQIGFDRASVQNSYDEMLDNKLGKLGKVLHVVKHPVNTLADIVSITEMGPRSAEIEASYKKYTSEKWQKDHSDWTEEDAFIQAFCDAQDVTVNFTKSGKWAKQINQVTAFFNVSIRGPEKLYRSIRERPIQTFVKGALWLTTIAVTSWYRNKDKDWYKNLPPAYKYNNLFFEIEDHVYRLPIPFELGIIFMAAPQAVLDTMKDKDSKSLEGLLDLAKAQIPDPTPSVFQPAISVATNKNYLGVPIESEGMQYLYPTERKRDYTTRLAIKLSKGMDKIGIQLSPIQLDYMLDSYSGGFLRQFRITGEELTDLPVIGDLMLRDPSYPKRQLNEYFSDWEVLRQKKQSGIATRAEIRELNRIDGFYKTYKVLQGNITKAKKANNQALVVKYSNLLRERLERYGYK